MRTVFQIFLIMLFVALQNITAIAQENKGYNFYGYLQSEKSLFF